MNHQSADLSSFNSKNNNSNINNNCNLNDSDNIYQNLKLNESSIIQNEKNSLSENINFQFSTTLFSKLTNISYMFCKCDSLALIPDISTCTVYMPTAVIPEKKSSDITLLPTYPSE